MSAFCFYAYWLSPSAVVLSGLESCACGHNEICQESMKCGEILSLKDVWLVIDVLFPEAVESEILILNNFVLIRKKIYFFPFSLFFLKNGALQRWKKDKKFIFRVKEVLLPYSSITHLPSTKDPW